MDTTIFEPTPKAIRDHLAVVVASDEFSGSERRRDLLRYLSEETLDGRVGTLKAYSIGTLVLGRATGFDPQTDPIVRVEIGRVRATLDRYYRTHPDAPVVITIPKGQYGAEFCKGTPPEPPNPATIAVLPFTDGGSDQALLYLADGLTHEIGLRLTRTAGLVALTGLPRDRFGEVPVRDVSDELGARFILSGHVLALDRRVRLLGELYDCHSSETIWADRLEASLDEVHPFDVEDWIVDRVIARLADGFGVINTHLAHSHRAGKPPGAHEAMLRYHHAFSTLSEKSMVAALSSLQSVADSNRPDARVLAALSDVVFTSWLLGLDDSLGGPERAERLAREAVAADPLEPDAHLVLAYAYFGQERHESMDAELERAINLDPRGAKTLAAASVMYGLDGDLERAQSLSAEAADLNPFLPAWWRTVPALAAFVDGDLVRAQTEAVQIGSGAGFVGPLLRLSTRTGLGDDASDDAKDLLTRYPDFDERADDYIARAFHSAEVRDLFRRYLTDAGIVVGVGGLAE